MLKDAYVAVREIVGLAKEPQEVYAIEQRQFGWEVARTLGEAMA